MTTLIWSTLGHYLPCHQQAITVTQANDENSSDVLQINQIGLAIQVRYDMGRYPGRVDSPQAVPLGLNGNSIR
ncbi:DUF2844 domain-containing protein [Caballeronia sp. SEWSISQ10-4 2]|uniref:DUF2844 domain-containing protein n=1 Tax=Caballeronia sp. SEWSISQ10-4 2 TaxID=2937438 RepID=UPI00265AC313|nr:DUF2844 domain-containing protein [Caballeronia sp. SEWSISQ10-4 2]